MANQITIEDGRKPTTSLTLNNGSLVILYGKMNQPIKSYLVTSYRGKDYAKPNSQYCHLIDLATGYPAFEEPSSRSTTTTRLLDHIYRGNVTHQPTKPTEDTYTVMVYKNDNYNLNIIVDIND